ncbi:histidine phosphatase family protein [Maribacter sp. 4U21]|uniref:SixA phosphatase family protein n=1 Tax=Maribacter sp. 4U21 TaxID=1889779 RepID=UPI000C14A667|nr:phosphoglycerate mutase family protein [Maribacter sp. 4U21]PIB23830.1 histidine phosphatase family protein [Maribacter sp. 4U21]
MKTIQILTISFVLLFISCKEDKPASNEQEPVTISTFYLIRHAEKDRSDSENADPELTQKGLGRAMHWAEILDEVNLDAIYTTDFNRTSMTAAPTSVKKNIDIQYYDPRTIDIAQFKMDNLGKKVLVVGHSNTTPDFVNKLIGEEKHGQIDDSENGNLYIVQLVNDIATDSKLNFNCNCPE